MTYYQIATIALTLIIVVYLVQQVRRRRIRGKYVLLWLVLDLLILAAAVFPQVAAQTAHFLGFQVTSNMLLVSACAVLFGVTIHLSLMVSRFEEDVRTLTEECAMLRHDLDELCGEDNLRNG